MTKHFVFLAPKHLKGLSIALFWVCAYLAIFSLFIHLFSLVWSQVQADPFPSFLAFVPASALFVFFGVRMFSAFWWGVRK